MISGRRWRDLPLVILGALVLGGWGTSWKEGSASQTERKEPTARERFVRTTWSDMAPRVARRFRVNSSDVLSGPFKEREEAKAQGMLTLSLGESLARAADAELYLEMWGGHPGTAKKSVRVNGRGTYDLPEVGTAEGHCTYSYPLLPMALGDLVVGENRLQFACDRGTSFWGHFILDNAALRLTLKSEDPDLVRSGLDRFQAEVTATPRDREEVLDLRLMCPKELEGKISAVEFWGYYAGYDENGDGRSTDWHGFTKEKSSQGNLATVTEAPWKATWDLSMVPDQKEMAVKAIVRFRELPEVEFHTRATGGLATPGTRFARVALHPTELLPKPFWSRASRPQSCTIQLPEDPGDVERAELHMAIWDGGQGTIKEPVTLNGHAVSVAGQARHDVLYRIVPVEVTWLKKGSNEIRVLSDTEHHGIEVLLPGPALLVRKRGRD